MPLHRRIVKCGLFWMQTKSFLTGIGIAFMPNYDKEMTASKKKGTNEFFHTHIADKKNPLTDVMLDFL
ncbi:MAG: hypothetical protein RR370_02580 [Synergistaceae bacterium]